MKTSDALKGSPKWDVCHVASGHEVTDTRIFRRECMLLREHGFDVSLMAQNRDEEETEGIRIYALPVRGARWYWRWLVLFPILFRLLTHRHDLVHFHDPDLLPVMVVYSWLTRKPVVWDAHENYESVITTNNKLKIPAVSRTAGKIYGFLELKACRLAKARIVTVSEPMADRYRKAGLDAVACANYVEHRQIPFPPQVERARPPIIAMTGTMRGESFEVELIEAFSILRKRIECRLAFWGQIWPASRDELHARAKNLGVDEVVECSGPFPWTQLVTELIPQSSVAVYMGDPNIPQLRHEIPNRLFEYWANGLPVIVARGTLCGELVDLVHGGITINYGNTSELVAALETLLKQPSLRDEMGANGRRAVLETYNWVNEGSKLVSLYDRILGHRFPRMEPNDSAASVRKRTDGRLRRGAKDHAETRCLDVPGN
jgi:glycosyltransferase involved in cell wall biosynthesis